MPNILVPSVVTVSTRVQYAPGTQLGALSDDTGPQQFVAQGPLATSDLKYLQVELSVPTPGALANFPIPSGWTVVSLTVYNRDTQCYALVNLVNGSAQITSVVLPPNGGQIVIAQGQPNSLGTAGLVPASCQFAGCDANGVVGNNTTQGSLLVTLTGYTAT